MKEAAPAAPPSFGRKRPRKQREATLQAVACTVSIPSRKLSLRDAAWAECPLLLSVQPAIKPGWVLQPLRRRHRRTVRSRSHTNCNGFVLRQGKRTGRLGGEERQAPLAESVRTRGQPCRPLFFPPTVVPIWT